MDGEYSGQSVQDWRNFITELMHETRQERANLQALSTELEQRRTALRDVELEIKTFTDGVDGAKADMEKLTRQRKTLGGLFLQMGERLNGTDGKAGLLGQVRDLQGIVDGLRGQLGELGITLEPTAAPAAATATAPDEGALQALHASLMDLQQQVQVVEQALNEQWHLALSLRLERLEGDYNFSDPAAYAIELAELYERVQLCPQAHYDDDVHARLGALLKRMRPAVRTSLQAYPGLAGSDVQAFMADFAARAELLLRTSRAKLQGNAPEPTTADDE